MEKIYKVKMYKCRYRDRRFVEPIDRLYTSLELMDFVKNTLHEKADTIDDALIAIYNGAGYVNEVIVKFTNDDFIGNIKPDGTMTQKLDLGAFALEVPRSEDLVANFDKLSIEQQKVICAFIDKAEQVLDQINKQYDKSTSYALINEKAKDILNDFVHDMFISDDRPNTEAQIMNMRKFNDIDLETLLAFLSDTVTDMPVADLMTDDFGTLSMYTDKFWHKIVVETAHNS
jgi:hypothetical protein